MTMAPPRIVVPCAVASCLTKDGRRHTLLEIETAYAVVHETCRFCRTKQTRIILDGKVVESRVQR